MSCYIILYYVICYNPFSHILPYYSILYYLVSGIMWHGKNGMAMQRQRQQCGSLAMRKKEREETGNSNGFPTARQKQNGSDTATATMRAPGKNGMAMQRELRRQQCGSSANKKGTTRDCQRQRLSNGRAITTWQCNCNGNGIFAIAYPQCDTSYEQRRCSQ